MVKKSKGFRASSRFKLKQSPKIRPAITRFLQEFQVGQNVVLDLEPSSHKGMPYPKFKGSMGKIVARRGGSYIVEIMNGNAKKTIISRPEHLKAI